MLKEFDVFDQKLEKEKVKGFKSRKWIQMIASFNPFRPDVSKWKHFPVGEYGIFQIAGRKGLKRFIKTCGFIMSKYSYGKQYEQLLETAELLEENILQPKHFHVTRFVSSECRVYETMMRDWKTFYELHEQESIVKCFYRW